MKKVSKRHDPMEIPQEQPDIITLLQEIKTRLVFLEKKVDALAIQPQPRHQERPFSHDRGDRGDRGGRDSGFGERSFTKTVCAECGQSCEVPFKPTGDRPVYCKECFSKREGGSFEGRRDSRPRSGGFGQDRPSGRPFGRRPGGDSHGFGKKPFGARKKRF